MDAHTDRTITVQLLTHRDAGDLRLDDFLEEMEKVRTALRETERLLYGKAPSLYFRIKKLQKNSPTHVTLEAVSDAQDERGEPQYASRVVRSLTTNLRLIARKKRPAKIEVPVLVAYRDLTTPIEKRAIEVEIQSANHSVRIDRRFRDILDQIIGADEISYGSLSGTIEAINLHDQKKRFWLYPTVGPTRVFGRFRNKDRRRFAAAVDKYVTVYGRLRYKTWDKYPYAIFADDVTVHDTDVPTLYDLKGVSPDATGDLTTQEYIDRVRDEW
jgi:hypothetical protein